MDGELLDSSKSVNDIEFDYKKKLKERVNYLEVFDAQFPYYLSIGMTEEQYWDKDCMLTKAYRQAEQLRTEKVNQQAWLQGMYVYDALSRLSPILRAFAKKGTKAQPYLEEAYPLTKQDRDEIKAKEEESERQKFKDYMKACMVSTNLKFKNKGVKEDVNNSGFVESEDNIRS